MKENKVTSYLLYAIGEIALVVIGILIAVNIDNRNEQKKEKGRIDKLLHEVGVELMHNISQATTLVDFCLRKDSLANQMLNYTIKTKEFDMDHDKGQLYIMFTSSAFAPNLDATNLLINYGTETAFGLDSIILNLKYLNDLNTGFIHSHTDRMGVFADKYREYLIYNTTWFYDFYRGKLTSEMVQFFINDPSYRNNLQWYRVALTPNYVAGLRIYIHRARLVLNEIHKFLNEESSAFIYKKPSNETLQKLVGCYQIKNANKELIARLRAENGNYHLSFDSNESPIYFINDSTFFTDSGQQFNILDDSSLYTKIRRKYFDPTYLVKVKE